MITKIIHSYSYIPTITLPNVMVGLFLALIFFSSCENDLKEVERIANIDAEEPIDISYGVSVLYSDSAVVKAKLISTEMIKHNVDSPFYEFPKDVLLIFYDKDKKEERRVTSKYGLYFEKKNLVELRHDVVVTMADGTIFKSEELFWDNDKRIFYNKLPLTITSPDGSMLEGNYFEADENFDNRKINGARGVYNVKEEDGF
ncbi:LPS export ABC transporter periplasmic protein LptC [Olivibacter sp. SDN3]|uniref:LPS export ABC transporter periplasmic protein LptC n=1 Tax=Olivibacter sp. SDN3 TaxID=2764720 RepID=UPI0016517D14|nr:LPS export ABC transporter periplasmic protein LptC [Olivibacter sp. SDN3]QNL51218.1 LPS export ABC transporter periplasmic protein LptC [Olivibacter sp. SDN3]